MSSWSFTITGTVAGNVELSIRCIDGTTSNGGLLATREITQQVTVPAGQTISAQVTCPVGYKGITASDTMPDGVRLLGDEPQPVTRVFTLQNTTAAPLTATLDLVCLLDTTTSTSSSFTTSPVDASNGETVDYEITVTNTGSTPLTFGDLDDPHCDGGTVLGGPGGASILPGQSATYTCSHVITSADQAAGSYANTATVTGTPPSGQGAPITEQSNTVIATLASTTSPVSPGPNTHAPKAGAPASSLNNGSSGTHLVLSHVVLAPRQSGTKVAATLTVGGSDSIASLTGYARAGVSTDAARRGRSAHRFRTVVVVRGRKLISSGQVHFSAALNAAGRRLLGRRGLLRIAVVVTVSSPDSGSMSVTRSVTLRGRPRHGGS
jgi:hypothetical protein